MRLLLNYSASSSFSHFFKISSLKNHRTTSYGKYMMAISKPTGSKDLYKDFRNFEIYYSVANLVAIDSAKALSEDNIVGGPASLYTLADGGPGDWFGGLLYSAGQQANETVQGQLSALSFTRFFSVLHRQVHHYFEVPRLLMPEVRGEIYDQEKLNQ